MIGYADGLDYVGGEQTVSIGAGESEACATFEIIDDAVFEFSETFNVALTSTDLMVDPQSSSAVVSIIDDGEKLIISVACMASLSFYTLLWPSICAHAGIYLEGGGEPRDFSHP